MNHVALNPLKFLSFRVMLKYSFCWNGRDYSSTMSWTTGSLNHLALWTVRDLFHHRRVNTSLVAKGNNPIGLFNSFKHAQLALVVWCKNRKAPFHPSNRVTWNNVTLLRKMGHFTRTIWGHTYPYVPTASAVSDRWWRMLWILNLCLFQVLLQTLLCSFCSWVSPVDCISNRNGSVSFRESATWLLFLIRTHPAASESSCSLCSRDCLLSHPLYGLSYLFFTTSLNSLNLLSENDRDFDLTTSKLSATVTLPSFIFINTS